MQLLRLMVTNIWENSLVPVHDWFGFDFAFALSLVSSCFHRLPILHSVMHSTSLKYTPNGILRPPPLSFACLSAGRRASVRHGAAFTTNPSTKGLHPWDISLRLESQGREELIEETVKDLHDVVCVLHVYFTI